MRTINKAFLNLIFLVVTLVFNTLGAIGIINGLSQKEVSDMFPTLITPGPATFSIWSVIYGLIIASLIIMVIKHKDSYYGKALDEISFLFWLSCIFNILWILAFSYLLIELSTLFIFALLITLTKIDERLLKINEGKRWLLPTAFGMYSGWLFIATVVNTTAALVKLKWNGFGISAEVWALTILIVAVVLVALVLLRIKNAIFPIPIVWAYYGIYQNLNSLNIESRLLRTIPLLGIVVLIAIAVFYFYKNRFSVIPAIKGSVTP